MSFRSWVSLITFVLLVFVVYFGWDEIVKAWNLMDQVNIWVWLLLIPIQFLSYYATGGMIFSYLKSKGNMKEASHWQMTRIALELNFVNHILPSGGAAGFSYLSWVLHRHGVSVGRSTMAQIVRFVLTFISFVMIVMFSVIFLAFDHRVDRTVIIVSSILAFFAIGGSALIVFIIGSKKRLTKLSNWLTGTLNKIISKFTRGKQKQLIKPDPVNNFFEELHQDYLEIRREKKIIAVPFAWAVFANILDVVLILVAFLSLGYWVSPAVLFIAFGIASIASVFSASPGGAGVYEAIMIAFLASSGISPEVAIAGTLLARVTLLLGTIVFGYLFYELTIRKYGKQPS